MLLWIQKMDRQIKHLLDLYRQKRFSQIENIPINKMLKIDSEEVTKVIKKNYSYLICTCQSSGKTGHGSLCRHKQFFILFPILELFIKKLDKLIPVYENWCEMNLPQNPELMLNDLKNLRRGL